MTRSCIICAAFGMLVFAMEAQPASAVPPAAASRLRLTPTGEAAGDNLGVSVSTAGDVNGDGYADVIVGAPGNATGGAGAGRAYIYYGGPGADAVADLALTGAAAGDNFGTSVRTAGDVNGDGYADVIVGAPNNAAGGAGAGRAYVYYGGPGADAIADLTLTGDLGTGHFGGSVSTAGDVNGDGYADVIVGAQNHGAGGLNAGRAYVYYGGPGADATADLTVTGAAGDFLGVSVSTAGDVNGDGYADVIVGATLAGNTGSAYVYYGGPVADATADLTLTGEAAFNAFGVSVSTAGDVNGDGFADVIVGARSAAGGAGRAYVYYGGPGADAIADRTFTGPVAGDFYANSVSTAGDVNGDGYSDVIVGARLNDAGGIDAGRAYVYYGGPGADALPDLTLPGAAASDNFGVACSGAGDVNGDGFADLIVGASLNDAGGVNAGRAYVYDINRYFVLSPNGGETWDVGATNTISWQGAEPADVWLSVDGGLSYDLLKTRGGGSASNAIPLLVPHAPTKFARVKVTPSDTSVRGDDASDALFTIRVSVALLVLLAAPAPQGAPGALVTWTTDPGPENLAGYRLERSSGGSEWRTVVALTRETSFTDTDAGPATRYRLFAVNGLGEELLLGEASFRPAARLAAWPVPYRGGNLSIAFATRSGLGGGLASADVSLFDASGRLVRTVARGEYAAGYQSAIWDGRDKQGNRVAAGVYFLRATSAGESGAIKFIVVR